MKTKNIPMSRTVTERTLRLKSLRSEVTLILEDLMKSLYVIYNAPIIATILVII